MSQIEWSPKILGQVADNDRISQNPLNQKLLNKNSYI